jgi:Rps23 Pro-64 3,4-dihydroxylase Tpa1-like proline 4-hydroxylase
MYRHDPCLEAIVYAFQEPEVVALIEAITGITPLLPDSHLYAGGISAMPQSCFLNPHVDNSHDKDRQHYRLLNLLYYTTPDWPEAAGGNLELWDSGLKVPPRTIWSKFNRLVAMITHQTSWHSVSPIRQPRLRTCVSNYYFGPHPVGQADYFHVTSFRGRPEQQIRDLVLQADAGLRMGLRQLFPKGVRENPHVYKH